MSSLSTCLWFAPDKAQQAVDLYVKVIPNARIVSTTTLTNEQQPNGQVQVWTLELAGTRVQVMGAAGEEPFTMAHSMWLVLDDQAEIDRVWEGFLAAEGRELACGWIADPFGLQWQVLPAAWERLTSSGDQAQAQRVAEALWGMVKIDIAALEAAAAAS